MAVLGGTVPKRQSRRTPLVAQDAAVGVRTPSAKGSQLMRVRMFSLLTVVLLALFAGGTSAGAALTITAAPRAKRRRRV